jgi:hypothetical protein
MPARKRLHPILRSLRKHVRRIRRANAARTQRESELERAGLIRQRVSLPELIGSYR